MMSMMMKRTLRSGRVPNVLPRLGADQVSSTMETYRSMSIVNASLDRAIVRAEAYFAGTKVERIVVAAKEASTAAKEFAFLLANGGTAQNERSFMFSHALETARLAFRAELLIRILDHYNRATFNAESSLDLALQHVNKMCLDMAMTHFSA